LEQTNELEDGMSSVTERPAVDLAPSAPPRPKLALALALLSVPGVTIAWDLASAAGYTGVAVAIAAIVVGIQARARLHGGRGTVVANIAIAIATLAVLSVVIFLIVGPPD
jgi:hypothetical protein